MGAFRVDEKSRSSSLLFRRVPVPDSVFSLVGVLGVAFFSSADLVNPQDSCVCAIRLGSKKKAGVPVFVFVEFEAPGSLAVVGCWQDETSEISGRAKPPQWQGVRLQSALGPDCG